MSTDKDRPIMEPRSIEKEIEITPEMIEAGSLALSGYTDFYENAEEGAARIYRAMEVARRAAPCDWENPERP